MIALLILGTGISAMILATSRGLAVAHKAQQYETARRLIGQVDLEIPVDLKEIEEGTKSGRFTGAFRDYAWSRETALIEPEDLEIYRIRTEVTWTDKGRRVSESVETYLFGPTYTRRNIAGRR
jgi:hypothetical protein